MILSLILLLLGFALLIKSADWLVDGSSALATRLKVSPMVIGLTIVAFGTSTPELIVNVFAAAQQNADICYGNIIGSNIVNILLILGIAALIRPLATQHNTVWREIPFALLGVLVLGVLVNDAILAGGANLLSRGDAIILLLFFAIFVIYVFAMAQISVGSTPDVEQMSVSKLILFIILGLAGLLLGGRIVVANAVKIATALAISQKVIGLTIVAIGTSLPELVTSAVAAYKNKIDVAVGNVVGSNIFNIFFILGVSGLVSPLSYDSGINFDMAVLLVATIVLFFSMFTGQKRNIDRAEAVIFLVLYVAYTIYLVA